MTDGPLTTGSGNVVFAYLSPDQLASGETGDGSDPVTEPGGCDCSITDDFNRVVNIGAGVATAGFTWVNTPGTTGNAISVDGSQLVFGWQSSANGGGGTSTVASTAVTIPITGTTVTVSFTTPSALFDDSTMGTLLLTFKFQRNGNSIIFEINDGGATNSESVIMEDEQTSFAWSPGTKYHVEWAIPWNTGTEELRLWADGDPRPVSPLLALDITAWGTVFMPETFLIDRRLSMLGGNPATADSVKIDDLNIVGVDRCTQFRFDNFDRTLSSGWGTSDYGDAWTAVTSNGAVPMVDGSAGRIAFPTSTVFPAATMTASDAVGPWSSGSFTMTAFITITRMSDFRDITLQFNKATGPAIDSQIFLWRLAGSFVGVGNTTSGTTDTVSYPWPSSNQYSFFVKYERIAGTSQSLKVWTFGNPEPSSWMVTTTASSEALISFDVISRGASSVVFTTSVLYDWIDFDYDGKPCYADCSGRATIQFDNFNRTVSSGWGTSDTGLAWNVVGAGPGHTINVNGTAAVLATTEGTTAMEARPVNGPWKNNIGWTMTAHFKMPNRPTTGAWEIYFAQKWIQRSLDLWISEPSFGFDVVLLDEEESAGPWRSDFSWVPNAWYYCKWEYQWDGIISRAKVWPDDVAEPATWLVTQSWTGDSDPTNDSNNEFYVGWRNSGNPGDTGEFQLDWIYFDVQDCVPVSGGDGGIVVPEPSEDNPATWAPVVTGSGTYDLS